MQLYKHAHGGPAQNVHAKTVYPVAMKIKTHVNTCIITSLVQVLKSCLSSAVLPTFSTFSHGNSMSACLANAYTWPAKNWMQYSARHAAITALLLSHNCLRSNLKAFNFKYLLGEHAPDPLVLHAYTCLHTNETSMLPLLAMSLRSTDLYLDWISSE